MAQSIAQKTPTLQLATELQQAYDWFNDQLFMGGLPQCLIVLQRSKATLGYFSEDCHVEVGGKRYICEIALNPSYFLARTLKQTLSTLVHEQVHAWQHYFGRHKSRGGYHNSEWASRMESVGLMPSSTGAPDGARTGDKVSHYIIAGGAFDRAADALLEDEQFVLTWLDRWPCAKPIELYVPDGFEPAAPATASAGLSPSDAFGLTTERSSLAAARLGPDLTDDDGGAHADGLALPPIDPGQHPEPRFRGVVTATAWPTDKAAQVTRVKYTCPGCALNAWAKAGAELRCGSCGNRPMFPNVESRGYGMRAPVQRDQGLKPEVPPARQRRRPRRRPKDNVVAK